MFVELQAHYQWGLDWMYSMNKAEPLLLKSGITSTRRYILILQSLFLNLSFSIPLLKLQICEVGRGNEFTSYYYSIINPVTILTDACIFYMK